MKRVFLLSFKEEVSQVAVIKVAILGFGTVGEGVYRTIHSHAEELTAILGKKVEVAAVLIKNKQKKRNIREDVLITTEFEDILSLPQLDAVVEAIVGKEPTFTFLKQAIQRGSHVITANKEMFAHHGKELLELAEEHHVSIGFEATVGGGIPIIQTLRQLLKINNVLQVQGILNGTSNFILTAMREKKQSFAEALLDAQKNGYAEADPTNDIEGIDAFFKTMILSKIAFGTEPNWKEIRLEGITSISSEWIETAEAMGLRFKHIANIYKNGERIEGSVKPALVTKAHPFYHVEGVQNAINVHTDIVGSITLQGPGAGMFPSASAVIEDLVFVCENKSGKLKSSTAKAVNNKANKENEIWFVSGISATSFHTSIRLLEQVSSEAFIIEAAQKDVEHLVHQYSNSCYYPILGEYKKAKETVTVI
jgi:homoserine dehydrogenase